jgi:predicted MFS family arabinose efflux permease
MPAFLTFLAAYILSQFFRSFLAVIAPEMSAELELGPQALGNLQAFWIAGFVALQLPVGYTLDHFGPRRTVASLMVAAVAGAVLFASARSALALNLAMALIGVGCSAIYMGAIYIFGRIYPQDRFAMLCSWLIGIGSAGNLLAATPLAYAAEVAGWRNAMLAIAVATALSAVAITYLVRDPPRAVAATPTGALSGLGEILRMKHLWPLLPITLIGYSVVLAERGLWAGPYLSDVFGLDPLARGNGLLLMAAAMSAGAMIYGPLDRFFGTRKWIVAAGSAVTAGCFLVLGLVELSPFSAIVVLALIGAFGMTYGVLMAHGRSLFPDHLLGRGITFLNLLFIGGAGLLQPLSGAMMARSASNTPGAYAQVHIVFGTALLVATAIYLLSSDHEARE